MSNLRIGKGNLTSERVRAEAHRKETDERSASRWSRKAEREEIFAAYHLNRGDVYEGLRAAMSARVAWVLCLMAMLRGAIK